MTQPSDIRYFLNIEEDRIPVANHMTLGRHLDNDVLLAGEDVLDYHLRIEMTDRGPRAVPLGEASVRLNGRDLTQTVGLMPGDEVEVGQTLVAVQAEPVGPPEADSWYLHGADGAVRRALDSDCRIGRDADNELQIEDFHISREHARLANHLGLVWLQDLGSSNGTFVNGERLSGACRLFHGDEIRFDAAAYQIVGRGGDLTPVRERDVTGGSLPLMMDARGGTEREADTTEFAAVDEATPVTVDLPQGGEPGAFLLGASEPVTGLAFRTPMGRTLIGRHDGCDVVIRDRTVSARHAELMVRAEGVTVTNLMATNGTRLNGNEIQSARLYDGDVLRFGRVNLVFKDVPGDERERPWLRVMQLALLGGALLVALGLLLVVL